MINALDKLTRWSTLCGSALTLIMMLVVCIDVAGRNIFDKPLPSVPELISLTIVAIVFLQLPEAVKQGHLPQSTLLVDLLNKRLPKGRQIVVGVFNIISAMVIGTVMYHSWPLMIKALNRGTYTGSIGSLTAPLWPVKAIIVWGCLLMMLQYLVAAVKAAQLTRSISTDDTH